jgi:hypothetical protein
MRKLEKKQQALEFYNKEYSYQEIADELNVSKSTAYRWVTEQKNTENSDFANSFGTEETDNDDLLNTNGTILERNDYNPKQNQHNSDNKSSNLNNNNELAIQKARMEHEYRMAQLQLEEKQLANSNASTEISENKIEEEQQPLSPAQILHNSVQKQIDDFDKLAKEQIRKQEQQKIYNDLIVKQKFLMPKTIKLEIKNLVKSYLTLRHQKVRKPIVEQLKRKANDLISKLKRTGIKNGMKPQRYYAWEPLHEIDKDLTNMLYEIDKSFFGSCEFEFPSEWIEELEWLRDHLG